MRYRFTKSLVIVLLLSLALPAHAGKKIRAYFIGNSYTYTNDLPGMLKSVAASMGDTLEYAEHDPGGWRLADHFTEYIDSECTRQIKTGNWDYIILQDQSQMPSRETSYFFWQCFTYAIAFDTLIRNYAPCSNQMLYMTWGYKDGDTSYCHHYNWPYVCTYEGMDSLTRARYMYWADSLKTAVSPVGAVRHYIHINYPGIELYQPDGSHPTVAATYAAACSFYATLFRRDPSLITYNPSLPAADASNIRTAARKVAFDSLSQWHIGQYDMQAGFSYTATAATVNFSNTSSMATAYSWDFGDGIMSTAKNPSHTYTNAGTYLVRLVASNSSNSCGDTAYNNITVFPAGISNISNDKDLVVSPNPAGNTLVLQSSLFAKFTCHIRITDIAGQTVYYNSAGNTEQQHIDISHLRNAMYFITVCSDGKTIVLQQKFVKE